MLRLSIDQAGKLVAKLTLAKRKLYPASFVQARGFFGTIDLQAEKKLLWIQPSYSSTERKDAVTEGIATTKMWLKELLLRGIDHVIIIIAGDDNPGTGAFVDIGAESHWRVGLTLHDEDCEVALDNVPSRVQRFAGNL